MQIPHGPKHLKCPFWQKAMSTCCHTCPMWKQLRLVDAQSGKDVDDEWNCSLAHLPGLLIENSLQGMRTAAGVAQAANAVDESGKQTAKEIALLHESVKQANILNSTILLGESVGGRVLITTDRVGDGGPS